MWKMQDKLREFELTGVLSQSDFLDEFAYRFKPGNHVVLFGPTGRGKTTIGGKMLSRVVPNFTGLLTIQLGPDPALDHLGKPMNSWPPRMPVDLLTYDRKGPLIRRYQPMPKKPEHFIGIRRMARNILLWMFSRDDWAIFIPDLQVVSDPGMMGLGKEVDQLLLTLRKHRSSVFMDAQAPRWIPSSAKDQVAHLLVWRNRSEDVVRNLAKIMGLPFDFVMAQMHKLPFHGFLWVDSVRDEYFIVEEK